MPTLVDAATDRRLRAWQVRLLTHLAFRLSATEFRPLKQFAVGKAVGLDQANVSRCLNRLTELGYLQRQVGTEGTQYRLTGELLD